MTDVRTTPTVTMRLDPETLSLLEELSRKWGATRTGAVRMAVRQAAEKEGVRKAQKG